MGNTKYFPTLESKFLNRNYMQFSDQKCTTPSLFGYRLFKAQNTKFYDGYNIVKCLYIFLK
jgi:hypothetical protein